MGIYTDQQFTEVEKAIQSQDPYDILKAKVEIITQITAGNTINSGQHASLHRLLYPGEPYTRISNCADCAKRAVAHWRGRLEAYRKELSQYEQADPIPTTIPMPSGNELNGQGAIAVATMPTTATAANAAAITHQQPLITKVGAHQSGQVYVKANQQRVTLLGWTQDKKHAVIVDEQGNQQQVTKTTLHSYTMQS